MFDLTESDLINKWTIIVFAASAVVSIFILSVYYRCFVRDPEERSGGGKKPSSSGVVSRGGKSASSFFGGAGGLLNNQRIANDWGPLVALGVDLGSYETKTYIFEQGALKLHGSARSIVTMYNEGFHFGEVDLAKQTPETTFFSLTRDMAFGSDVQLELEDVTLKPFQACGILLKWLIGERSAKPPIVAVGIPPYLNHFTNDLYLSAMAAGVKRFFCFRQSAALMAALLRHRRADNTKQRFCRHVVFVDAGRSGISAYFCEVRDTAASMKRETHRSEGLQEMERAMVMELAQGLDEEQREDPHFLASIVEAAAELRYDFASTPAYLMSTAKKVSRTRVNDDLTVEMDRERFTEILEIAKRDVELVADEVLGWLREDGVDNQCDLVLSGNGFKLRDLRSVIERVVPWRSIMRDKIAVAQGLAVLGAMQHPRYQEQRYDIDPLYEAMTLEESGLRPQVEEETGRSSSMLSPLLGRRNSSNLDRRRGTAAGRSAGTPGGGTSSTNFNNRRSWLTDQGKDTLN